MKSEKYSISYRSIIEFAKTNFLVLLKVIISIGLVFYLIQKISIKEIFISINTVNVYVFSFVVLLSIINLYLQFIKWKSLLRCELNDIDDLTIFKSLLIGFSAGSFTPARSGEYFLRKMVLKNLPLGSVITLTFIDKLLLLFNVIFWGALVSFGMMLFYYQVDVFTVASLFILFASFFSGLFVLIYSKRFYEYLKNLKNRFKIKIPFVRRLIEPLSKLDNRIISKLLFISFLNYLVIIIEFALIVYSHNQDFVIQYLLIASIMIMFTKTLIPSITLGEIGIRESAAIYFFGLFGCSESISFNSSLILFGLNILIPSLVGLYFLITLKRAKDL